MTIDLLVYVMSTKNLISKLVANRLCMLLKLISPLQSAFVKIGILMIIFLVAYEVLCMFNKRCKKNKKIYGC